MYYLPRDCVLRWVATMLKSWFPICFKLLDLCCRNLRRKWRYLLRSLRMSEQLSKLTVCTLYLSPIWFLLLTFSWFPNVVLGKKKFIMLKACSSLNFLENPIPTQFLQSVLSWQYMASIHVLPNPSDCHSVQGAKWSLGFSSAGPSFSSHLCPLPLTPVFPVQHCMGICTSRLLHSHVRSN